MIKNVIYTKHYQEGDNPEELLADIRKMEDGQAILECELSKFPSSASCLD